MNKKLLITTGLFTLLNCVGIGHAETARPTYSIELAPGFSPTVQVASNATATIKYTVRNLETVPRILMMLPIAPAINQIASAADSCPTPVFMLASGQSCTLELQVNGALIPANQAISGFPTICKTTAPGSTLPDPNRCARTSIPLNISGSNNNRPITPADQIIAFYTSYTNSMTAPLQPTLPTGFTPWKVQPVVTFIWKLFAKALNGQTGVPSSANLTSSSCGAAFNGSAYCVLVGQNNGAPFIMQSYNGGTTWTNVNIPNLPAQGQLNAVSCITDPNGKSSCVAIGVDSTQSASQTPIVVQTLDSGNNWSTVMMDTDISQSILNSVNCTGNAANNLCQITGYNAGLQGPVIYYAITPTGNPPGNWTTRPLFTSGVDPASSASALSCVSLANSDISCLVALSTSGGSLSLFKGLLSGPAYSTAPIQLDPMQFSNIRTFAVSCTLNAGTPFCVGAGSQNGIPFIMQNSDISFDNNWIAVNPTALAGSFITASCIALNSKVTCVAGGSSSDLNSTSSSPLLAATMDGSPWSTVTVAGVPNNGYYTSSGCSISSGAIFCFVNGTNDLVNLPFSVGVPGTKGGWQLANTLNNVFTLA